MWSSLRALHLSERSEPRERDTHERAAKREMRGMPVILTKTNVEIQFPFQVIASAFNSSVHYLALSKVKACHLGPSCFPAFLKLSWNYLETIIKVRTAFTTAMLEIEKHPNSPLWQSAVYGNWYVYFKYVISLLWWNKSCRRGFPE